MSVKQQLATPTKLWWWKMGEKVLSFDGTLGDLLKYQGIYYTKRKTDREGIYTFEFKNDFESIIFTKKGIIGDFKFIAMKFIQMELVRLGDKSQLYVSGCWRPMVTVNF